MTCALVLASSLSVLVDEEVVAAREGGKGLWAGNAKAGLCGIRRITRLNLSETFLFKCNYIVLQKPQAPSEKNIHSP